MKRKANISHQLKESMKRMQINVAPIVPFSRLCKTGAKLFHKTIALLFSIKYLLSTAYNHFPTNLLAQEFIIILRCKKKLFWKDVL